VARTKLHAEAVRQLLAFVKECESPCPAPPARCPKSRASSSVKPSSNPRTSGTACPRRAKSRSSKISSLSSRS
jgi:hypothetical protein